MSLRLLKCEWKPADCNTQNQGVDPNPDVAGIGVIVGFLSTTSLAFFVSLAVVFLDHYEEIINFFRRNVTKNKEIYKHDMDEHYWRSPYFWFRVLSKNLLALSDTQLLTGTSIQLAALLRHCDFTIYHFQIVTHLAVLTTITHVLTIVTLRDYFVNHNWINLPRVLFMFCNIGMLGYTSFVSYSYELARDQDTSAIPLDQSMSLACFFQRDRPQIRSNFGWKWTCLLMGSIGAHFTVVLAMYFLNDDTNSASPDGHNEKKHTSKWSRAKWVGAVFRNWVIVPAYAIYCMILAGKILKHTDALGHSPVIMTVNDDSPSETQWGFSQFLPVLLLALPVFAGWESFWEEKDEDRDNRFTVRKNRGSQNASSNMLNMVESQKESKLRQSSPDISSEERKIESSIHQRSSSHASISPMGTPHQRAASHVSISPLPTPLFPSPLQTPQVEMANPHLAVPQPTTTPGNGGPGRESPAIARGRSPSRFEEHFT